MLVPEGNHPFLTRTCDSRRSGLIVQVVNDVTPEVAAAEGAKCL
jgi:hypothetical protein